MALTSEIGFKKPVLSKREVVQTYGLSHASIYRGIKAGTFPAPLKVSVRRVAWLAEDLENWLAGLQHTNAAVTQ